MRRDYWLRIARAYLSECEIQTYSTEKLPADFRDAVKKRVFETVWSHLRQWGETSPPVLKSYDAPFVRRDRKARVLEVDDVRFARTEVTDNGFSILIGLSQENGSPKTRRWKRVLLSHELAHTFLYDLFAPRPVPLFQHDLLHETKRKEFRQQLLAADDGFVWEIARELLIPTPLLAKHVSRTPSLRVFFNACTLFCVTREFMAKRLFWSRYNFKKHENYWPEGLLIIYPSTKLSNAMLPPPHGSKEVYRGKALKRLPLRGTWWEQVAGLIERCKERPGEVFCLNHTVTDKEQVLRVEGCLTSGHNNVTGVLYLVARPDRDESQEMVQLSLIDMTHLSPSR